MTQGVSESNEINKVTFNVNENQSGFDMKTFTGRLRYYFEVCGPW